MAERKPGPVKPPTIDLTAREVAPGGPEDVSAARAARRGGKPAAASASEAPVEAAAPEEQVPARDAPEVEPASAAPGDAADMPLPDPEPVAEPPAAEAAPGPPEAVAPVAPEPQPAAPEPPPPPPPPRPRREVEPDSDDHGRRAAPAVQPWGAILASIVAGALLGTALTYFLAGFAPLPANLPPIPDPSADLAAHAQRLEALESANAALADQAKRTQAGLDATIAQLDTGLTDLRKAIADAQSAAVPAADLGTVRTELATLSSRLDAVAAGASSPDAAALAGTIATLQNTVAGLGSRLAGLEASRDAAQAALTGLTQDVAALKDAAATQASVPPPVAPSAARSGAAEALATALDQGASFSAELAAAAAADAAPPVPPGLEARAGQGLPTPDALARRFALVVPDMLAASRPAAGEDWQQSAFDWVKALLAVRPSAEVEGDAPEAVMSRLEAAVERHDFAAAAQLAAALPPEMRAAGGSVLDDIALRASADAFVAALRAPAGGTAQ